MNVPAVSLYEAPGHGYLVEIGEPLPNRTRESISFHRHYRAAVLRGKALALLTGRAFVDHTGREAREP